MFPAVLLSWAVGVYVSMSQKSAIWEKSPHSHFQFYSWKTTVCLINYLFCLKACEDLLGSLRARLSDFLLFAFWSNSCQAVWDCLFISLTLDFQDVEVSLFSSRWGYWRSFLSPPVEAIPKWCSARDCQRPLLADRPGVACSWGEALEQLLHREHFWGIVHHSLGSLRTWDW